ncbi:FAD-dependent monooxygenase [Ancylobacter radicis]|uniref:FAD-dependent monooxygenase n=1 Tax=Ancylobacter radicis TaxID=2836179 RepID=A0ABS5R6W2_9HYPH|nr:FAD-dependent monooxygenase [Ancylobacter radicis]
MAPRSIVVAGAGIGGLTAALALAKAGFRVTVLERAGAIEEVGAGVQLAANATRCLQSLGVYERVRARAVVPTGFAVIDGRSGRTLTSAPMGAAAEARFDGPFLVIHRADLQQALAEAAREHPAIEIRLGRRIDGFTALPNGIAVQAEHGDDSESVHACALVGADGLRSSVRGRLHPGVAPSFRHRAAWRATIPAAALPARLSDPVTRLWLGPGAHLVSYPVKAGAAINLVAITPDERQTHGWGVPAAPQELLAHYRGWCDDAHTLLTAPPGWLRWALFDLDPLAVWGAGPVTLLGDAAHAMCPFLAQGAAQAIEDAVVLAACLKTGTDIPASLRRYEALRRPRTARVQSAARGMDRIYHLSGPARIARDLVMRARSGKAVLERYRWIYGWRP